VSGDLDERAEEGDHLVAGAPDRRDGQLVPEWRAVAPAIEHRDAAAVAAAQRLTHHGDRARIRVLALQIRQLRPTISSAG
jgi:alkylhydroperoxidase family enzyme